MEPNTTQEQNLPSTSSNGSTKPPAKINLGKRPFFKNKHNRNEPPVKRAVATFSKTPENKLTSTYPLQQSYELATLFTGVRYVSLCFYDLLSARDGKMTQLYTCNEFYYIILLSVYYRCAVVANTAKTTVIFGLSDLKNMIENIELPDAIATYVETFGSVKLSSSAVITPYFRGINEMQNLPGFIDPVTVIRGINQLRADNEDQPYPIFGDWSLSPQIVVKYSKASSRALKGSIEFRRVNFNEVEGRPELLCCYEVEGENVKCAAYDKVEQSQCQLGAAFRLHGFTSLDYGVPLVPMFGAPTVNADVILTNHFLRSLRRNT
jgi:hypothetical protein